MAIEIDDELRVGDGWRYQCKVCDYQVGIDRAFPKTCPGCGMTGWWGHLVTPGDIPKLSQKNEDGKDVENCWDNNSVDISRGVRTRNRIMSQDNLTLDGSDSENNGIFENSPARKKRPSTPRRARILNYGIEQPGNQQPGNGWGAQQAGV